MCVKINSFAKQKKRRRKAIENVETIKWAAQCYGFTSFRMGEQVYGLWVPVQTESIYSNTKNTPNALGHDCTGRATESECCSASKYRSNQQGAAGRRAGRPGGAGGAPPQTCRLAAQNLSSDIELTPCDHVESASTHASNSSCVLARSLRSSSGLSIGSNSS